MPSGAERVTAVVHGASGYTGAETLRWLLGHPRVTVVGATANKHAGKDLSALWPQFSGIDLRLTATAPAADVHFLCLPHGEAAKLAPTLDGVVIDLSGDHRLPEPTHSQAYGWARATAPWAYGLPELNADLRGVTRVANPGCFATALALALLPLRGQLPAVVTATGLTGSTGSGATPTDTTHHPNRAENLRPYKVLAHQHVPEVVQAVAQGDQAPFALDFVPMSAPIRRGILVTIPVSFLGRGGPPPATPPRSLVDHYRAFYAGNPLVRVLAGAPDLHGVLGSARADVGVVENTEGRAVVFCAIDNLCRGAGSQAVANLNRVMGWPVDLGLRSLPPVP